MKQKVEFQQPGSFNVYRCESSGREMWVRHIDPGVTPFLVMCKADGCHCGGKSMAKSGFYPKTLPDFFAGQWEWYRPTTEAAVRIVASAMVEDAAALHGRTLTKADREHGNQNVVDHWANGGCLLRKSSERWGVGQAKPVTLATPDVEPINRDGVEPGPGDLGIFRSIADLATRGLVHFVGEGDVIPKGLAFKRWAARGGGFNVAANLMADGYRMRVLVRSGEEPQFDLFIDPDADRGPRRCRDSSTR